MFGNAFDDEAVELAEEVTGERAEWRACPLPEIELAGLLTYQRRQSLSTPGVSPELENVTRESLLVEMALAVREEGGAGASALFASLWREDRHWATDVLACLPAVVNEPVRRRRKARAAVPAGVDGEEG